MSGLRNVLEWTGIRAAGELLRVAMDGGMFSIVVTNVR